MTSALNENTATTFRRTELCLFPGGEASNKGGLEAEMQDCERPREL